MEVCRYFCLPSRTPNFSWPVVQSLGTKLFARDINQIQIYWAEVSFLYSILMKWSIFIKTLYIQATEIKQEQGKRRQLGLQDPWIQGLRYVQISLQAFISTAVSMFSHRPFLQGPHALRLRSQALTPERKCPFPLSPKMQKRRDGPVQVTNSLFDQWIGLS